MSCPSLETLSAWALGELAGDEQDRVEEHVFSCDRCVPRAERALDLVRALGAMLPVFLTEARRRALDASGRPLTRVPIAPGEHRTIEFGGDVSVGYWILRADLATAARVDCELRAPDGALLVEVPDAPFDRERGELVLACQRHYEALGYPREIQVRVVAVDGGERRPLAEYFLDHVFHPV
jgi:anti-sigma factor RsiW